MEVLAPLGVLCLSALTLLALVGTAVIVLVKLGVITSYALKEEPPDEGVYSLEQSQEAGEPEQSSDVRR